MTPSELRPNERNPETLDTGPGLWIHPARELHGFIQRRGIYLLAGYLAAGPVWWLIHRTNPALARNPAPIALYILGTGLCLGHLAKAALRFFHTRNLIAGIDTLLSWIILLATGIDGLSLQVLGIFVVYVTIRATLPGRDWLTSAATKVHERSETEKTISRPYTDQPLPIRTASAFSGFPDIRQRYARWLARKGAIPLYKTRPNSTTLYLSEKPTPQRNRDHSTSWIRIDDHGNCTTFICERDRHRLGGRKYTSTCRQLTETVSNSFSTYILKKTKPAYPHRSRSARI